MDGICDMLIAGSRIPSQDYVVLLFEYFELYGTGILFEEEWNYLEEIIMVIYELLDAKFPAAGRRIPSQDDVIFG